MNGRQTELSGLDRGAVNRTIHNDVRVGYSNHIVQDIGPYIWKNGIGKAEVLFLGTHIFSPIHGDEEASNGRLPFKVTSIHRDQSSPRSQNSAGKLEEANGFTIIQVMDEPVCQDDVKG